MTIELRPATANDVNAACLLLQREGLPVADVDLSVLALAAEVDGSLQGVIGVEKFENIALLRSLVVSKSARGLGIGTMLVRALESECAEAGIAELWLLTIDAADYFSAQAYTRRNRNDAPRQIRSTAEFSELCPDDAVLMSKRLS